MLRILLHRNDSKLTNAINSINSLSYLHSGDCQVQSLLVTNNRRKAVSESDDGESSTKYIQLRSLS